MTIGERIKKVRKTFDLTQQEFADQIGSKRNTIATYEMGRTEPSAAVISLICREFDVSETWLRAGDGEMFIQQSKEDELASAVERLITGESAEFKLRLVSALSALKEEHWLILEQKLKEIIGMRDAAPAHAPEHTPTIEEETRAEAEEFYRRRLEERERELQASSAKESGVG